MSTQKIGVNLRVTESSNQGGRKYMEDLTVCRFEKNKDGDFEFAYFAVFDGHGGAEASRFAKDYLLDEITKYECFWNDNDEDVKWAIRAGFLDTHYAMWKELDHWPRTLSGLPSTAGTTASIGIIKNCKLYIGHVGDSGIAVGFEENAQSGENSVYLRSHMLTKDHKPECPVEKKRIEKSGGEVLEKCGVQRVVWNRPQKTHKGPVRRSTPIDKIPFLAVARSLGDLWSFDYLHEEFVVSPDPDVSVHKLNPKTDRCLVLGSDGLWNMMTAEEAVTVVMNSERQFESRIIHDETTPISYWINPAEKLMHRALTKWRARNMRADNTSAIVIFIDPLGPRKLSILKQKRLEFLQTSDGKCSDKRLSPRKQLHLVSEKSYCNLSMLEYNYHLQPSCHSVSNHSTKSREDQCKSPNENNSSTKGCSNFINDESLCPPSTPLHEGSNDFDGGSVNNNLDDSVQALVNPCNVSGSNRLLYSHESVTENNLNSSVNISSPRRTSPVRACKHSSSPVSQLSGLSNSYDKMSTDKMYDDQDFKSLRRRSVPILNLNSNIDSIDKDIQSSLSHVSPHQELSPAKIKKSHLRKSTSENNHSAVKLTKLKEFVQPKNRNSLPFEDRKSLMNIRNHRSTLSNGNVSFENGFKPENMKRGSKIISSQAALNSKHDNGKSCQESKNLLDKHVLQPRKICKAVSANRTKSGSCLRKLRNRVVSSFRPQSSSHQLSRKGLKRKAEHVAGERQLTKRLRKS